MTTLKKTLKKRRMSSTNNPKAETVPVEQTPAFDPEALKKIAGTSMTVEDNGDIRLSFKRQ
mgnify:CR=1 FL=1